MSNSRFGFRTRKGEIRGFIEGNVAISNDSDAQAFINAAGITDATQQSAINTLVVSLKNNSLWTKFNVIYPFVGGTATTHKFNLKNPADTDAAFRLTFLGGWTHTVNGATPNGSNGTANTYLNPSISLSLNSTSISIYSRTDVNATQCDIGMFDGSNQLLTFTRISGNHSTRIHTANFGGDTGGVSDSLGMFISTRTASNVQKTFKNGSLAVNGTTVSNGLPNGNLYLSSTNGTGNFSTRQLAFASIGGGLSDSDVTNFNTAVQAFQTTLSRNV
jgi:hypothetical protein